MRYSDLFYGKAVVPLNGATVTVQNAVTGEVVAEMGLEPGIHALKPLLQHFGPEFVFAIDCAVVAARGDRGQILVPANHTETGANPDWRPQRMTDNEKRLMGMIRNVQARVDSIKGREKALQLARERQSAKSAEDLREMEPEPVTTSAPEERGGEGGSDPQDTPESAA